MKSQASTEHCLIFNLHGDAPTKQASLDFSNEALHALVEIAERHGAHIGGGIKGDQHPCSECKPQLEPDPYHKIPLADEIDLWRLKHEPDISHHQDHLMSEAAFQLRLWYSRAQEAELNNNKLIKMLYDRAIKAEDDLGDARILLGDRYIHG